MMGNAAILRALADDLERLQVLVGSIDARLCDAQDHGHGIEAAHLVQSTFPGAGGVATFMEFARRIMPRRERRLVHTWRLVKEERDT